MIHCYGVGCMNQREKNQIEKQIDSRIKRYFNNISRTRYWITLNYYSPTDGYNMFFWIRRPRTLTRSYNLVDMPNCSFDELLEVLTEMRKTWGFSIEYLKIPEDKKRILNRRII